ncbi:MAG: hypothetical protein KDD62_09885, partial [Bdellovibrionales bacterium]|nr:hypothetical protein [Bdellovibrionales bacterium]
MLNHTQSLDVLHKLRKHSGIKTTHGLSNEVIESFLAKGSALAVAIEQAHDVFQSLSDNEREMCSLPESELIHKLQDGILNFYPSTAVLPFVPLAAQGPWMVTTHGAVVYDTGGYGMLGLGHNPDKVLAAMSEECVMANVMSASFWQYRFLEMLRARIGFTRPERECPYEKFVCMNSGSEAMSVA